MNSSRMRNGREIGKFCWRWDFEAGPPRMSRSMSGKAHQNRSIVGIVGFTAVPKTQEGDMEGPLEPKI